MSIKKFSQKIISVGVYVKSTEMLCVLCYVMYSYVHLLDQNLDIVTRYSLDIVI